MIFIFRMIIGIFLGLFVDFSFFTKHVETLTLTFLLFIAMENTKEEEEEEEVQEKWQRAAYHFC